MILVWLAACAPFRAAPPPATLPPCEGAAAPSIVEAFAAGVRLSIGDARALFPGAGLDPVFLDAVEVRAGPVAICGGWLVGEHVRVRLLGPRGAPMEAGVASTVRPGPVLGVHADDARVDPPAMAWRIVGRHTLAREAPTVLGRLRSYSPSSSSSSTSSPSGAPSLPPRSSDR